MKNEYLFDEIKELLPQDYPFIFIDKVMEIMPGERIICRKNISGNEWMFPGHFPNKPIFPGVLLIEAMAQASILLFKLSKQNTNEDNNSESFLLSSVKSRFLEKVIPGDQIELTCEVTKMYESAAIIKALAKVDGKPVSKAELTFAVQP
ncbi:3-hydroxyacyl-ACP dehydratase FabZ [Cytobacillus purgationiresistens]|uniref:3-hydroxyacyl-[acyl-carrier-protein] dehydratase n=1 Tax=Cytobacillus purgationiresistens TaxID=863449 RepID=A0ABU0AR76_9BACI|nr:3-hydroxyacyl-ACP dehydratase FabZ [Cytobacillus purgationiresistens]MDQ0273781.1 3-hydroxyacyl-[acyl-carrier-protein] dehydratase [Cytobacillus purgationiresistens]